MKFSSLSSLKRASRRPWYYPLLSATVATSLIVGTPQVGQAISWFDILLQGARVVQLSNMSTRQEIQLGQQINQQIVNNDVRLYGNRQLNQYINQLGQRLAKNSDRPDIPYTFQVVDDPAINAFATMGGFVYVNTGTIAAAANEAELASVIAHEIAHIAGRHAVKQMRQAAIAQGISTAAGVNNSQAVQLGVQLALSRPRSRQDEYDADQRGLLTLRRAGYAEAPIVSFMQKLMAGSQGGVPTFLSTHPGTGERINNLRRLINPARANVGAGLNSTTYNSQVKALLRYQ
ncbi:MAG TPA: M48 family metallopeptidase [Oculatellaceae cyanobacterium]|jgi:predicted Zn-dependent protease